MNIHTDTLRIGELLNAAVGHIVPVYPCVVPTGVPSRFCVYRRTGFQGRDTKDLYNYTESISLELAVVAEAYPESLMLAQKIKESLDGMRGEWQGLFIDSFKLTNASEQYSDGAFVQSLFFRVEFDTSVSK